MVQVFDFLCCDPVLESKESHDDDSITCSTDEGILECDYDTQVTKLYHGIEERQWEEVLYFLETGNWYATSIFSAFGDQGERPAVQAKTWVTALDDDGDVRWCQLPLHAAVTFLAPFAIIRKLVEIYPKSVRCADDQDMLPLHYAFRFGVDDEVLVHLLEAFPQAISKKAVKDRLPLDLAQYGPRPERGVVIDYYMQSAVRNAKTEWDSEYEKIVSNVGREADQKLKNELDEKTRKLNETMEELLLTRKELANLQLTIAVETGSGRSFRPSSSNTVIKTTSTKSVGTPSVSVRRRSNSRGRDKSSASKASTVSEESGFTSTKSRSGSRSRGRQPEQESITASTVSRGFGKLFGKRKK
jgi:hypothetical protein